MGGQTTLSTHFQLVGRTTIHGTPSWWTDHTQLEYSWALIWNSDLRRWGVAGSLSSVFYFLWIHVCIHHFQCSIAFLAFHDAKHHRASSSCSCGKQGWSTARSLRHFWRTFWDRSGTDLEPNLLLSLGLCIAQRRAIDLLWWGTTERLTVVKNSSKPSAKGSFWIFSS